MSRYAYGILRDALRPLYPLPDRGKQPVSRLLLRRILHRALQGPPLLREKGLDHCGQCGDFPCPKLGKMGISGTWIRAA